MWPTLSLTSRNRHRRSCSSPSHARLQLLLLFQRAPFVSCEFGCLVWGTGENIRYGETTYYSFCDVQYAWGDDTFWCEDRTEPTPDPNDERAFSMFLNHVSRSSYSFFTLLL